MPQSFSLNEKEKKYCLELARKALEHYFERRGLPTPDEEEVPEKLREKKACFVTLTKKGELRGCIGHLEPVQKLYLDIIDNTVSSAVRDNRFPPVEKGELGEIRIEVSVLTEPEGINFSGPRELLEKISAREDGLIIQKGYAGATFLPSVWEQLSEKEEFLSQLCLKAGLPPNEWKKQGMKVQKYEAIKAKEE